MAVAATRHSSITPPRGKLARRGGGKKSNQPSRGGKTGRAPHRGPCAPFPGLTPQLMAPCRSACSVGERGENLGCPMWLAGCREPSKAFFHRVPSTCRVRDLAQVFNFSANPPPFPSFTRSVTIKPDKIVRAVNILATRESRRIVTSAPKTEQEGLRRADDPGSRFTTQDCGICPSKRTRVIQPTHFDHSLPQPPAQHDNWTCRPAKAFH